MNAKKLNNFQLSMYYANLRHSKKIQYPLDDNIFDNKSLLSFIDSSDKSLNIHRPKDVYGNGEGNGDGIGKG